LKNKILLFCLLSLFFTFCASSKAQKIPDRPVVNVEVDQVKVNVIVEYKNNLIQGLTEGNFKIYEDKVLQEINYFSAPEENPVTVVLVIEFSQVIPRELLYEAWLSANILVNSMGDEDWIAIMAYDIRPEILLDFTQDKKKAYIELQRLNSPAFRESNLYDAMFDVLERLEEVEGEKAVVLVSSGLDTFSKKNLDEILKMAKKTEAVIYSVSLGGNLRVRSGQNLSDMSRMDLFQADSFLKYLAKYTGGKAFFPRFIRAFPSVFENIFLLLHNQYAIGYISESNKEKNKFRKIKVEVIADVDDDGKPDKLKAIHREGYYPD